MAFSPVASFVDRDLCFLDDRAPPVHLGLEVTAELAGVEPTGVAPICPNLVLTAGSASAVTVSA
jgi:hypothetical protein